MKNKRNMKGITLVALVVTIVVLLILAGVSIDLVLGDNGIIKKAQEAKKRTEEASQNEQVAMEEIAENLTDETNPYLPSSDFRYVAGTSVDTGLVIEDKDKNQYVWVVVPKRSTVYKNAGLKITEFTEEEYKTIEADLIAYTENYKKRTVGLPSDYKDEFYADSSENWFANKEEYDSAKQIMLKSIYINGGFYVGRYEAGSTTNRADEGNPVKTPVSIQNAFPYNYVTRTQAKHLAESVNSGNKNSSLMFGIQWDLMLTFIHQKGKVDDKILTENGVTMGNYNDNTWNITNSNAQYSVNNGDDFTSGAYNKTEAGNILLTTGADSSFSKMNIYDIAGNVWEWTLEKSSDDSKPCTIRGGAYYKEGSDDPASSRNIGAIDTSNNNTGFRVAIY